jgi:hypothetical protein
LAVCWLFESYFIALLFKPDPCIKENYIGKTCSST